MFLLVEIGGIKNNIYCNETSATVIAIGPNTVVNFISSPPHPTDQQSDQPKKERKKEKTEIILLKVCFLDFF